MSPQQIGGHSKRIIEVSKSCVWMLIASVKHGLCCIRNSLSVFVAYVLRPRVIVVYDSV